MPGGLERFRARPTFFHVRIHLARNPPALVNYDSAKDENSITRGMPGMCCAVGMMNSKSKPPLMRGFFF